MKRQVAESLICDVNDNWTSESENRLSSEEFVGLLLRHEPRIRSFIVSLTLPLGEVDDIFQNTCIVALRKLDSFSYASESPDECFVRWLCTIARFEVLQLYRDKRTGKVTFDTALVEELADMQLKKMEELRDRAEYLADCIDRLPERERTLMLLRYGENKSVSDIAYYFGLSINGVYKALERIRGRLLTCIRLKVANEGSR